MKEMGHWSQGRRVRSVGLRGWFKLHNDYADCKAWTAFTGRQGSARALAYSIVAGLHEKEP